MDDVLRAACLTVIRHPGATLAGVIAVLTRDDFRWFVSVDIGRPGTGSPGGGELRIRPESGGQWVGQS